MKRLLILLVFVFAGCKSYLLPCPTVTASATEQRAVVREVFRTSVTIELNDGSLWAFRGEGFEVGDVITIVMSNGRIIRAYKE